MYVLTDKFTVGACVLIQADLPLQRLFWSLAVYLYFPWLYFPEMGFEEGNGANLDSDFTFGSPLSRGSEQISEFNHALKCDENLDINCQWEPVFHAH